MTEPKTPKTGYVVRAADGRYLTRETARGPEWGDRASARLYPAERGPAAPPLVVGGWRGARVEAVAP